jgi:septal ring factor EnvC (AmiA/AmiB activator)
MSEDDQPRSDTETGFGTGLRAKLEGRPDHDGRTGGNVVATAPLEEVGAPAAYGEPNGDVQALRAELAAALARERDLRTELATQNVLATPDLSPLEAELRTRGAELDARAARLGASETEIEERERRVSEQVAMVRTEKERLSEIENRVVGQDALSAEREVHVEAKLRELKDAEREQERLQSHVQKQASTLAAQEAKFAKREAAVEAREAELTARQDARER